MTTKTTTKKAPVDMRKWGDPTVSEREYIQDTAQTVSPVDSPIQVQSTGILAAILHHVNLSQTVTLGGGTATKDAFGPHNILNSYQFTAGGNTPIISGAGIDLYIMATMMELTGRSLEANDVPASTLDPLTNSSDFYNFATTAGATVFRLWYYMPIALPLVGAPGGAVGYLLPQNRRVTNIIKPHFSVTGGASPFSDASLTAAQQPVVVTGAATSTVVGTFETWKELYTVPRSKTRMPLAGFSRQIQTVTPTANSAGLTYDLPAGGTLLRAMIRVFDGTALRGIATTNVQNIVFQYGATQVVDNMTPNRNIMEQLLQYGRVLPQGCFVLDYYTRGRSFREVKSLENSANPQILVNFISGYTYPAGSITSVTTDKVFVVRNRAARMG